jgi:hypothetical protein
MRTFIAVTVCALVGVGSLVSSTVPSDAACNAICRQKCDATWMNHRPAFSGPKECYAHWSKINAKGREYARGVQQKSRAIFIRRRTRDF